jgi:hypothetical protein
MAHKIIDIVLLAALVGGTLIYHYGYKDDTPKIKVVGALIAKYPTAMEVKWVKESKDDWEAIFMYNGAKYAAHFTENGTWTETVHELNKNSIPKEIALSLRDHFSKFVIEKVEISEKPIGVEYRTELTGSGKVLHVNRDNSGNVLK